MSEKRNFDKPLLNACLLRDGATLVGEYETLNRDIQITFKCKCGCIYRKTFRSCNSYGCYCKICIMTSAAIKTHPHIMKDFHPTKNGDLLPETLSSGSGKIVWWLCAKTCPEGCKHEYQASINNRCNKNSKCPYCVHNPTNLCAHTSFITTHSEIAKDWHPTKNGNLLPETL